MFDNGYLSPFLTATFGSTYLTIGRFSASLLSKNPMELAAVLCSSIATSSCRPLLPAVDVISWQSDNWLALCEHCSTKDNS